MSSRQEKIPRERVLVVDDGFSVRVVLIGLLAHAGLEGRTGCPDGLSDFQTNHPSACRAPSPKDDRPAVCGLVSGGTGWLKRASLHRRRPAALRGDDGERSAPHRDAPEVSCRSGMLRVGPSSPHSGMGCVEAPCRICIISTE
jgi:hypothetical protein